MLPISVRSLAAPFPYPLLSRSTFLSLGTCLQELIPSARQYWKEREYFRRSRARRCIALPLKNEDGGRSPDPGETPGVNVNEKKRLTKFSSWNNSGNGLKSDIPEREGTIGTRCLCEFLERAESDAERVDGPASRWKTAREEREGGEEGKEREDVAACWWVYEERAWRSKSKRATRVCTRERRERGRTRERESPAYIRYLSRRCCVQVNKLTRRRASAIFFPINLNLLLTLFPYPLYPPPSPAHDSLFPPLSARSLRLFVSTIDVLVVSYSFLISRRFCVPSLPVPLPPFLLAAYPSRPFQSKRRKKNGKRKRKRRRWHRVSRFTAR